MSKLLFFGAMIILIQILAVALTSSIRQMPKKQYQAKDIIASNGYKPELYKAKTITIQERILEVEEEYGVLKKQFSTLLKKKELDRPHVVALRRYLESNVNDYEHKKFKNDSHAIQTMLAAYDLKPIHISTIKNFLGGN